MTAAVFDQDKFAGRCDNGSQTTATWKQSDGTCGSLTADVDWTQLVDENFRLRFVIQETAGGMTNNVVFKAQYNLASAGWNDITNASSVVKSVLSSNFADEDATTQLVGSGSFLTGAMFEDTTTIGDSNQLDFTANIETEIEGVFQIVSGDVAHDQTLQIKIVTSDGSDLGAYTVTPTITVDEPFTTTAAQTLPSLTQVGTATHVGPPVVTDVETDEDYDDEDTALTITGTDFLASQGSGKVEMGDNADHGTAAKVEQTIESWSDTAIDFTADLGAQSPGDKWIFVTNNSSDLNDPGFAVTVHRVQAFKMSASANIAASGEATTVQLTAPAGKSTGDFDAGRIQDDENPADTVDITLDDYTEMEWSIEAKTGSRTVQYDFRVTDNGVALTTYTVTPQLTITSAAASATAVQTLPSLTQVGTAEQPHTVTAAQTLAALTQAGVGDMLPAATAAQTLAALTQVGTAEQPSTVTAAQTLASLTQAGVGDMLPAVTAVQTLPSLTQAGVGDQGQPGAGAQTLPSLTQVGVGDMLPAVTAAQTLPSLIQTGTAEQPSTVTAAQTLASLTQAGVGDMLPAATAVQTLPSLTQVGTAEQPHTVTSAQTLASLTQAGVGDMLPAVTAVQTLPSLIQAGAGISGFEVEAVQTLASLTQAGVGDMLPAATAAQTLPSVTQVGTAEQPHTVTSAQTLAALTQAGVGLLEPDVTVVQTLPSLTQVGAGIGGFEAEAVQTLSALTQAGVGDMLSAVTAVQTLPSVTQAGTSEQPHLVTAVQILAALTQSASADAEDLIRTVPPLEIDGHLRQVGKMRP